MDLKVTNKKILTMFATLLVAFSIFTIQPKAATTTPGSVGQRVLSWIENYNGEQVRFNCLITTGTEQANTSTSLGTGNTQSYKTINIYVSADKPVNGELYMVVTLDNTYSGTRYTYNVGCMFANGWGFAEYQTNEVAQLPYDMYPYDLQKGSVAIESITNFGTESSLNDYLVNNDYLSQIGYINNGNYVPFDITQSTLYNSTNTLYFRFANWTVDSNYYYIFDIPATPYSQTITKSQSFKLDGVEVLGAIFMSGTTNSNHSYIYYSPTNRFNYAYLEVTFDRVLNQLYKDSSFTNWNAIKVYKVPRIGAMGQYINDIFNKYLLELALNDLDNSNLYLAQITLNTSDIKTEVTGIKGIVQAILDHLTGNTDNPVNDKTQGVEQKTEQLQNSVNTVDTFENSTISQMDSNFNAVNINSPSYKGIFGQMIETTNFYRDYLEGINTSVTSSSYVSFIWIIPLILMVVLFFLGA